MIRLASPFRLLAVAAIALAVGLSAPAAPAAPVRSASSSYLPLAVNGVAKASAWRDHRSKRKHGDKHWYDERLNDHDTYPLATVWGIVPLFESIDYIDMAQPSPPNTRALDQFAHGAEKYWDPGLPPHGGYAPYPNDRGRPEAWMDDNGWWGLAFFDAYRATHESRYLTDAERAFNYANAAGWDPSAGGLWWNTHHPYKSGVAIGANSLLGARIYSVTHDASYLNATERMIAWASQNLMNSEQLYAKNSIDPTSQPYVEGPFTEADQTICAATGDGGYCTAARVLADRIYHRFHNRYSELQMGPQFDTIYLRVMLDYGRETGDGRWLDLAKFEAQRAIANAAVPGGLYLRAWDGSDMSHHQAQPGMLRTHAGTIDLFASLAAAGA